MTIQEKVLIVEDEENERSGLAELVSAWGYRTETAKDGLDGLEKVAAWSPAIVVTDLRMPKMDGMELLHRIAEQPQQIAVVLLTAQGSIDLAVDAMKIGAYDFIPKPVDPARLKQILQNAVRHRGTSLELEATKRKLRDTGIFGRLVGSSRGMQEIFRLVEMVAPSTASVLITGESGTGKELVARTIHDMSPRKPKPFVAINCSAIPETLIESEIFGHEKGAFTGAIVQKKGKLEVAEGGTVFLDEIGELAPLMQAKLLRVLQEREFERVGGTRTIKLNVRLITATNRDLETEVKAGRFREDLYYRLNVVSLRMPSLRDRRSDISLLASYFAAKSAKRSNRPVLGISPQARACLLNYDWPGNVRELENAIERAVVLGSSELILPEDLPESILEKAEPASSAVNAFHDAVREAKKQLIINALEQAHGNYTDAARLLGLHPNYLHRLVRNLSLRPALQRQSVGNS